jgi:hypothetical protein
VAEDRGVQPGLALVQPEAVLAEFEIFFYTEVPSAATREALGKIGPWLDADSWPPDPRRLT